MTKWLLILLHSLVSLFRIRRDLAFENLLLRQQLAVMKEKGVRPQLSQTDRSFWVLVSKLWPKWRDALHIVKPEPSFGGTEKGFGGIGPESAGTKGDQDSIRRSSC